MAYCSSGRPAATVLEPAQAHVVLAAGAHCARRINGSASSGRHRTGHRKRAHEPCAPALGFYVPAPRSHLTAVQPRTFRRHGARRAPGAPSAGMPRSSSERRRVHEKRCHTASTALARHPYPDVTATRNTRQHSAANATRASLDIPMPGLRHTSSPSRAGPAARSPTAEKTLLLVDEFLVGQDSVGAQFTEFAQQFGDFA